MKRLKLPLKIVFSTLIIAMLFWKKVDLPSISEALRQADPFWIFMSFILHPLGLLISSYRWQLLLKAQDIEVGMGKLYVSYLVCGFFNQFLPTRVGGDLIRAYDTKLIARSGTKSFAIVVVERMSGIVMLMFFALIVSLISILGGARDPLYIAGMLVGGGGAAAIIAAMLPQTRRIVITFLPADKGGKLRSMYDMFHETIVSYWSVEKRGYFAHAFLHAFLLQLNVIIHYYLLGLAFNFQEHCAFQEYFVIVPLIQMVLMIPLFINGIGIREGSWIAFFSPYGIIAGAAFAFSLIDFAMYLVFGIIGGILYAIRR